MRQSVFVIVMILVFTMAFVIPPVAGDNCHGDGKNETDHSGEMIRESTVDGHKFTYHLIDMREKMKGMKNMPEMKATHHLMVYAEDSHGHKIEKGKVGYLVEGPGDSKQKAMAMAMSGGFGADMDLSAKGKYAIKTKIAAGDKKLMDKFVYEVK